MSVLALLIAGGGTTAAGRFPWPFRAAFNRLRFSHHPYCVSWQIVGGFALFVTTTHRKAGLMPRWFMSMPPG